MHPLYKSLYKLKMGSDFQLNTRQQKTSIRQKFHSETFTELNKSCKQIFILQSFCFVLFCYLPCSLIMSLCKIGHKILQKFFHGVLHLILHLPSHFVRAIISLMIGNEF